MFLYPCCLKYSVSLDKFGHVHKFGIYSKRKKEKEKVGGRPSKLNEKKRRQGFRARDKKQRRHFCVGRIT